MTNIGWLLLGLSVAAGSVYLFRTEHGPYRGRVAVKGLAVGAMTGFAASWLGWSGLATSPVAWLLILGLGLSTLGDVLLGLSGERNFLRGLVAFLLAHAAYGVLFLTFVVQVEMAEVAAAALLAVAALGYLQWLRRDLGGMAVPVLCYLVVIVLMGCAALLAEFSFWWAPVGALAFMFSDAVLAADRFARPFRGAGYIIWICYYAGQLAIASGVVAELRLRSM